MQALRCAPFRMTSCSVQNDKGDCVMLSVAKHLPFSRMILCYNTDSSFRLRSLQQVQGIAMQALRCAPFRMTRSYVQNDNDASVMLIRLWRRSICVLKNLVHSNNMKMGQLVLLSYTFNFTNSQLNAHTASCPVRDSISVKAKKTNNFMPLGMKYQLSPNPSIENEYSTPLSTF